MIALLVSFVLANADRPHRAAPQVTQAEVTRRLDLTSFPNSTGPRRKAGAVTPADYGFTKMSQGEGWTVLSAQDSGWTIRVRLLSADANGALICFLDQAQNGGTYRSQSALEVALGPDGLFHERRIWQSVGDCVSAP